ncbi:hypothetical protein [Gloeothece verrucosa]|uniref:Uncharacterized protein n=1 Tax=Gloeothece verrucosa (strain PCC 7822) TaxID=497965 RepID=E0UNU3_GLOV7|nr:hypothetical protein [Gloeothece verrucosa]ADN18623.1 hypothetical protein Cyan7822_6674 [Gloeothece verrucosa PCC 7822]
MNKKNQPINPMTQKVEYLMRAIYFVETKLGELETSLLEIKNRSSSSNHDLPNAARVTGFLQQAKVNKVELSESQLIEVYNEIPQLLSAYAVKVALTPESFREPTEGNIFLEESETGNYWIIRTGNEIHLLVPKVSLKFDIYKLKTVQHLFSFQGEVKSQNSEFFLMSPAKVSWLSNGKQWKLEDKGELYLLGLGEIFQGSQERDGRLQERQKLLCLLEQVLKENQVLRSQMEGLQSRLEVIEEGVKDAF